MQDEKGDHFEGNSYIVPKWKQNINSNELGWKNKIDMNCQNNNIDEFCNKNEKKKIINNCKMYPLICEEDKDIKKLKCSISTSLNKLKKNSRSKVAYYKEYESENLEEKDIKNVKNIKDIKKESTHYVNQRFEDEEVPKCIKNNSKHIFQESKIIQKKNKSYYDLEPQVIIENMNKAINNSEFIKNMNYYFEEINSNTQSKDENNNDAQSDKTCLDINIEKDKLNEKELSEFMPKISYNDQNGAIFSEKNEVNFAEKNEINFVEKNDANFVEKNDAIFSENDLLKNMNAHVYAFKEHCDYLKIILNELKDLMNIIYTCFQINKNDNCLEKQINSTNIINKWDEYFSQNSKEINLHDHVSKNMNFQKELFYCRTLKINDEKNIYSSEMYNIYVNCLKKFMKNELSVALENIRNILNNPNCEISKEGVVNKIRVNNLQLAGGYTKTEYITKENQNDENNISTLSLSKLINDMSYIRQYIEELKMNCIKENEESQAKIKKQADSSENENGQKKNGKKKNGKKKNEDKNGQSGFDGQSENNNKYQNKISELENELLNTKLLLAQSETLREIELNEIKKSKYN
ncbi:hypothetical protein YYC_05451 [Plasmodium yoelii 17X]|uniref:Uncharacterized protein n=1 Tax=Plasmodium yoelii 17X TaxID=1323249 RepID=V7PAQ1_PLAYE|nr:hypothetical protein YYC_05451 [Plasmodium yoelii 17X]